MQRTGVGRRSIVLFAGTLVAGNDTMSALAASTLPTTGRTIPFLAAGVAIGIALLLRAGRSKLDDDDSDDHGG